MTRIAITAESIVLAMCEGGEDNAKAVISQVSRILSSIQIEDVPESTHNELESEDSHEEMFHLHNIIGNDLVVGIDFDNDIVYGQTSNVMGPFFGIPTISYEELVEKYSK